MGKMNVLNQYRKDKELKHKKNYIYGGYIFNVLVWFLMFGISIITTGYCIMIFSSVYVSTENVTHLKVIIGLSITFYILIISLLSMISSFLEDRNIQLKKLENSKRREK